VADTLTSKGLILLDPNLAYDVTKFNTNFQKTNDLMGTIICTSLTRPSTGLYDGMTIYETDTKLTYYRSSGAWVTNAIPPMQAVANAAARDALTGLWNGRQVWRTDKGWVETYDGTAWRVPNSQRVAALADITHPLPGQLAILSTDDVEYRYVTSVWTAIRYTNTLPLIERRHNAASQATGASAAYKVLFDTVVTAGVGITYTTGNFFFGIGGVYNFTSSIRLSAASELYMWFARSSVSTDNRAKDSKPGTTGLNKSISGSVRVQPSDQWSVYVWSGTNVNIVRESGATDDQPPYFSAHYIRPL
jgi:hypothetical protein